MRNSALCKTFCVATPTLQYSKRASPSYRPALYLYIQRSIPLAILPVERDFIPELLDEKQSHLRESTIEVS